MRHDETTATTRRAILEWSTGAGDDGVRMTETFLDFDPVLPDWPVDGRRVPVLGTELLGRRVGEVVRCAAAGSMRNLRAEAILYQPAAGDLHL